MWKDILLLFIGALLPILTLFLERIFNLIGNVVIHSKFIADNIREERAYVMNYNSQLVLNVPLKVEIINNKNKSIVIRNLNLALFNGKNKVADFIQGEYSLIKKNGETEKVQYGDNENYSFIVESKSIKIIKCDFFIKQTNENLKYDNIKLSYYNGEKQIFYTLINNIISWQTIEKIPTDWVLNKKEKTK